MAFGDLALFDALQNLVRQPQKAQHVRDRRSALAAPFCDSVLRHLELVDQLAIGARGLDDADVLPLKVLYDGHLELLAVAALLDNGGNRTQACPLSGAKAPFAGDELIPAGGHSSDQHRLQYAMFAN